MPSCIPILIVTSSRCIVKRREFPSGLSASRAIPSDGVGTIVHRHWIVLPSSFPWRVGVYDIAFEACSSLTSVTACRVARPPYSGLCHEASTRLAARPGRSSATMFTDNYMGFPHWQTAPVKRTRKSWLSNRDRSRRLVRISDMAACPARPGREAR